MEVCSLTYIVTYTAPCTAGRCLGQVKKTLTQVLVFCSHIRGLGGVQISGDQKKLVASFYAHHLCVFDIESQKHTQTLENDNSLLLLHVAALTWDGSHLVHANYDENDKVRRELA